MRNPAKLSAALLMGLFFILPFSGNTKATGRETTGTLAAKIRITNASGEAVISLYDTPASKSFASLLPLAVTFRDYAGEEKITDLPQKLPTEGGLTATDAEGDFTYYAPWGNLAVFYKGFGKGERLYILGRIESGKDWLAGRHQNFAARIESIE